jgi:SAM-dependent methyltransferase
MQPAEYDTLRALEDQHWWYAVLHRLVLRALLEGGLPPHAKVLDAGCGTGGMLDFLSGQKHKLAVHGIDASAMAVRHCHERGLTNVGLGTVHELPFADETFDVVLSLDVLYHDGVNDSRALAEMRRVMKPGGLLVLNLPAFECLRGSHDAAVCGVRRYRSCHVRSLLESHSLHADMIHYWNSWLFLPLLVWRRWSRQRLRNGSGITSDLELPPAWLNRWLVTVGQTDARLCRWLRIPLGSSVFAVARKTCVHPGGLKHAGEG